LEFHRKKKNEGEKGKKPGARENILKAERGTKGAEKWQHQDMTGENGQGGGIKTGEGGFKVSWLSFPY